MNQDQTFLSGLKGSAPIMTGYIPIAIAYGVIGIQEGIPPWVLLSMSILIYAGASQFMAINLFSMGISPIEMMFTIGVINLRHIVMGISFQNRFAFSFKDRILSSLGLTDETFATLSLRKDLAPAYMRGVMVGSYGSWIFGAVMGILFGHVLPPILSQGLAIAIYVLFITLLTASLKGRWKIVYIPLSSMMAHLLLSTILPSGLSIVLSILIGAIIGSIQGGVDDE